MKTTTTNCTNCHLPFEKRNGDYNRTEKRKGKHYCSLSCSVSTNNKTSPRKNTTHLRKGQSLDSLSPFRYYMNRIVNGSGKRFGKSDITTTFLRKLYTNQKGLCALSQVHMKLPRTVATKLNSPFYASLDRKDSTKGYLKTNVQFVCQFINLGKRNLSDTQAINFINNIKNTGA